MDSDGCWPTRPRADPVLASGDADQIGANIAAAVAAQPLALTPTYLGDGLVHLGGDDGIPAGSRNHVLDTSTAANISDTGRPGVSDAAAVPIDAIIPGPTFTAAQVINRIDVAIQTATANKQIEQGDTGATFWDGRTFSVVNRGRTYTFEYDNTRFGPAEWRWATSGSRSTPAIQTPIRSSRPHPPPPCRSGSRPPFVPRFPTRWSPSGSATAWSSRSTESISRRSPSTIASWSTATGSCSGRHLGDSQRHGRAQFYADHQVEESYDIYNPDPRLPFLPTDYTVQPAAPPPPGRNMRTISSPPGSPTSSGS